MKKAIIRTKEQIGALIKAIKEEYDTLPPCDIWGTPNSEAKAEMEVWLGELLNAYTYGIIPDSDSEVEYWLTNEKSYFGKDFGVQ